MVTYKGSPTSKQFAWYMQMRIGCLHPMMNCLWEAKTYLHENEFFCSLSIDQSISCALIASSDWNACNQNKHNVIRVQSDRNERETLVISHQIKKHPAIALVLNESWRQKLQNISFKMIRKIFRLQKDTSRATYCIRTRPQLVQDAQQCVPLCNAEATCNTIWRWILGNYFVTRDKLGLIRLMSKADSVCFYYN
jgi:hypothetical protein